MWKPNYEKKQTFIGRWLERRRRVRADMEDNQFHWKQIHHIRESQAPLDPSQKTKENIPKEAKTVYPKESAVEIRLLSTERGRAEVYVYAARKDDCIVTVASGFAKTGNQTEIRNGQKCYYADKICVDNFWLTKILSSKCPDEAARIMFKTHGYHRVFVRLKFDVGQWYVDMVGADKW